MAKLAPIAGAIVVGLLLLPNAGQAATDDVAALRAELEALKTDYTSRVQALETRIKQLESAVATAQLAQPGAAPAPPAFPQPSPVAPSGKSSNATAFNPAISMILTGNYASLSQDPATYRVAGFIPPPSGEGPGDRSFNLDESELTVASNVDPYFFGNVTAAIQGGNSIDIEEAYFKTLALNSGFTIKGGRFFSGTGYLNEIHSHNWDFVDQPLVYQVFLGGQLAQDGVQIRWLAPADYFIELGAEAGSGRSFPGTQRNSNSLASEALFAHLGVDVGDSNSSQSGWYLQAVYEFMQRWRAGLRYDSMQSGTPSIGLVQLGLLPFAAFPSLTSASPERTTIMVDWSLSEFSRLRAQYAWDDARATERERQFLLQYILAMGAHGAHKF